MVGQHALQRGSMTQRIQTVVIAWLLVSVVVCVGFLALVTSIDTRVLRIPVSDADRHLYPGLYAREANHRWSSNAQQLRIPTVRDVPHIITLALCLFLNKHPILFKIQILENLFYIINIVN